MVGTEEEARGNVFPPLLLFISHITERKCKYSFRSVPFRFFRQISTITYIVM